MVGRRRRGDRLGPGLDRPDRGGRRGGRADRPDAWPRPARRRRPGPPAGHPVERSADVRRMRCDPRRARSRTADRHHRQRRADRVHGAEARLGPRPRAGALAPGGARPAAQGLPAPAADRRARHGQGRRLGHAAVRPGRARLVRRGPVGARDPARLAAADVRGSAGHRRGHRPGRRRDRAARRDAGRGRRRRPGGQCGRRRGRVAGNDGAVARDVGRRLRRDRPAVIRATRARPRVLPRGPGSLAPDVGDAVRGRQPALVPRHPRPRRRRSRTSSPRPWTCPPVPTACSSCPTCPASGARIPTRWRGVRSSA